MRRFGLIGYPLSHSFSKQYFTEKFHREQLTDCVYELFPVTSVEQTLQIIKQYPDLDGLNVTIPYKQAVVKLLTKLELPEGLMACNCIKIEDGKLIGFNTDVTGFERSFSSLLQPHHKKALILGNGGATAAIAYVLIKLGIVFHIVSRKIHNDSTFTYADLNESILNEHPVIINTTPVGMYPAVNEAPEIPYEYLTDRHFLFDCIYNPEKTIFLQEGEKHGAVTKNGMEMLVVQAEESWKIWNRD